MYKYFRYTRQQVLENGATGRIAFDDNGDRIYAEYDVINVKTEKVLNSVGRYYYSTVCYITKLIIEKKNTFCTYFKIWPTFYQ